LIIARDEVSLSSHVVMMPTHVANIACALATICTCVGLIGFGLVLLTMDQSIFNLENQSKFVFLYIKIRSIEFKDVTSINLLCHDK
jgi:hypothetical protein